MSEHEILVSRALSARAATVARRLADVVELTCSPDSGAQGEVEFLRGWADSAQAEADPVDGVQPLDRVEALGQQQRRARFQPVDARFHRNCGGVERFGQ